MSAVALRLLSGHITMVPVCMQNWFWLLRRLSLLQRSVGFVGVHQQS
jgi:hypothetical protein